MEGASGISSLIKKRKKKELERLQNFELYRERLKKELSVKAEALTGKSDVLTKARKTWAGKLECEITQALKDFEFSGRWYFVSTLQERKLWRNGVDRICFMISTNPANR